MAPVSSSQQPPLLAPAALGQNGLAERDRVWWRDKLDALHSENGGEAFHEFATDYRRPATPSGKSFPPIVERLDASTVTALTRLAQACQINQHSLLLTLLAVEAGRRDRRQDLILGTGTAVRRSDADGAVECFDILLPVPLTANGSLTLTERIRATQAALAETIEHQGYPSAMLYEDFRERHPDARSHLRNSLFDISLTANLSGAHGNAGTDLLLLPNRMPGELGPPSAGVDLAFEYEPIEDGSLKLLVRWNPDVYRRETAHAWLTSFAGWAHWLAEDTGRADAPLPLLLPAEARCLERWEHGPALARPSKRFHELFESVADQHPHRAAVITEHGEQSYAQLEQQANRVARTLQDCGVTREEPVAVLTECSADLPATIVGIWKAGATYVPLALDHPPERLAFMVKDSGARTLIVLDGHFVPEALEEAVRTILRPEDWGRIAHSPRPKVAGSPQDLAYIIYTSGTTGMPKGVLMQHDSLVNAACASGELFGLTPDDRFSLVATPGFDASLWELGASLLSGMAVVPVSRALRDDPWSLKRWYKTHGVTVAFHTPSYLRVSRQTPFDGLRVLIVGGEPPTQDDVRWHANHVAFWNACGPTETCIFICAEQIPAHVAMDRPLTLGRPLANARISIRRDNGERVPPGVIGEVWLGGVGLARGYLNNPDLTDQRFVETPDGRFYRSGDMGRWTEDGRLELAGRIDDQVKLHGQRVELGEIEERLSSHPAVEEAVTLLEAAAEGTKVLRAFVRLRSGALMPGESEWREYLGAHLPMHMIPASVTSVAAIPLGSTGKVDREALLRCARTRIDETENPPSGEIETRIAALWEDLLAVRVSREDNFFALGGNSLLAVTMAHRLSSEFGVPVPARELFVTPVLAGFAQRVAELIQAGLSSGDDDANTIAVRSDLATEGQREFWVAETADLDTRIFAIPVLRVVEGEMPSPDRWNTAWAELVARHEALRTYFYEDAEGRLRRTAVPSLACELETAIQPDGSSARAFIRECQGEPFIMGVPPLWRAGLVEVADSGEHLFWLSLHHSVGDGQSIGILVTELGALLRGEGLPPLTGSFAESSAREEAYLAGPSCAEDARYWHDLLVRQPEEVFDDGQLDFPRSATAQTGSHRFTMRLDSATAQGLRSLGREHSASLHAVMLTLLALEAQRRTRRSHIVIGTAASLRETAAEAHVMGDYINMLPVPCRLLRKSAFGAALRETQKSLEAGLWHARYPFARMCHDFWNGRPQQRHPARYPLFDLAVTEVPEIHPDVASLRLTPYPVHAAGSAGTIAYERTGASPGQDMVLVHETLPDGGLLLQWQVNAALYTRETAENWFQALSGWAAWLTQDRQRATELLPSLLPDEAALLERWEHGPATVRPALRAHELFEHVLDDYGNGQIDRPAVVTVDRVTSYGALEREANSIAHSLLQRGAAGIPVGVLTERSANLPAAVLGIWKAGATYVPLSAELPPERLAFMARDAGVALLMVLDGLAIPSALVLDTFRPEEMDAEFRRSHRHRPSRTGVASEIAYITYTSGSTGHPKGTLIGHDSYVNLVLSTGEILGITRDDRSLMFSAPSFDVSLSDIGLPLAFGAALCPVPYDVLSSPRRFVAFLTELNVTVADITPTYLRLFDGAALSSLRVLVTGGEAPFAADVQTYARRHKYFNAYGPTENTITSTMSRLSPEGNGTLCAGRPLPNTSIHVCDADGEPVPPGMTGEVWLAGTGLARGYVGRPELTAGAFVETVQGRRYRTGDLGRWNGNGEIQILGRADDQVKLNGIRVELGEIEHALGRHPDVGQAVAVLDGDSGRSPSLWAFVRLLPGRKAPTEEAWRDHLASRLPEYMIPSDVIAIPEIPVSSSGKVDKAALKMLLDGRSRQAEGNQPRDGLETQIAGLWTELLGHGPVHRDDNFFALGGHSLLAIAMANRLEEMLGYRVPARELFAEPVLCGFARRVDQLGRVAATPAAVFSDRATEGQCEFWAAEQAGLDTRSFNILLALNVEGEVPPIAEWQNAWAMLVARHDALRTRFEQEGDVLRRSVVPHTYAKLEDCSQPDISAALAHIRERQALPFAMGDAPLWRAGLVHVLETAQPVFWLTMHHSVADGASLVVLSEELSALLNGRALPPVTGDFRCSAGQEESYLGGSACQEDSHYWREVISGLGEGSPDSPHPFDEWPLDLPRPPQRTERNARGAHVFRVRLDAAVASGLRAFAQRNGVSLHALILTLMAQEVRRRTGRSEFLLGTAASTRDSANEARVIGYYVNMLPVPCRVCGGESFEQSLRTTQRSLAEGLQHARYPFARMYRDFRRNHSQACHPARYPLFDLAVTEDRIVPDSASNNGAGLHFGSIDFPAGSAKRYELFRNAPPQDMVLLHSEQSDGSLVLRWYANAALYERETAEGWIDSLAGWTRFLAEGRHLPDSPLPSLLPDEETLLARWEQGPAIAHSFPTFLAQFEHWARVQPDRPALITEKGTQSYAVLNARANALAHALLAEGVARQEPVGVLTARSTSLPEIVLAIWKAGGCYLPLVSDLPAERLAFIARDAGLRVLVLLDGHEPPSSLAESGCAFFRPESLSEELFSSHCEPPQIAGGSAEGSDPAYIIYTSGSTGLPKGVVLHHQGMNNLGVGMAAAMDLRCDDRCLMLSSPGFDLWISDLATAWTAGAAVVPITQSEMEDVSGMRGKIARLGISVATMTPSYLRLFEQADLPGLRVLMTVGEQPHLKDALYYAARLRYINAYGPTENTADATVGQVVPETQQLTAGRPLANTSVHIRGSHGEPVPPGAAGEVWLGGKGLATGYLNRPDLTAAAFVETPEGRRYRTGDLGRWTRDGGLQILGRLDGQVKLRGQRVELGEIEHRLATHPSVRQAVAAVEHHAGGLQSLWAFVRLHPRATEPTQAEWQDYLSQTLPSYMMPSSVFSVPTIPMNTAGKVDRAALVRAASEEGFNIAAELGNERQGAKPHEGVEEQVAQVWKEHLGRPFVAREDNFFDLGGDSLRVIAVVNQLRRTHHCTVNDLYEHPRLADFAGTCRQRPEHLRELIRSAARHWRDYRKGLAAYEMERDAVLLAAWRDYEASNQRYRPECAVQRRDYREVLLTGATGYLGSYLLRELLADRDRRLSVLVRGVDDQAARARLGQTLVHYFGPERGAALRDDRRLTVLAGDLRRDDLGLSPQAYDHLADGMQAVIHCAANVKHFGHYREFHADNVAATARLLKLAAHRAGNPADFHFVSTLSVCGKAPEETFRLFTEYDAPPAALDENYYVRSKQEAERLVVAARQSLPNACIHRVGSLVFAAEGGPLQLNLKENALFRQIAAFIRLGVAPDDSHLWLCHVDLVARGLVFLASAADLTNETHHLENARRDTLASLLTSERVRICEFDAFLERLEAGVGKPELDAALNETLANFGLYRGQSPQARGRRLEIVSERTQMLLTRFGLAWPQVPNSGREEMLRQAARHFDRQSLSNTPQEEYGPKRSMCNAVPNVSKRCG